MLRIIGGTFRGRKLKTLKGLATRPVLGRVREALFNVLGNIEGLQVLDLYAGSGTIGIEALSRGAEKAVFVDSGFRQCRIIRENLGIVGINAEVIRLDSIDAVDKFRKSGRMFDFVFADPPYEKGLGVETLNAVCGRSILTGNGIMATTVRHTEDIPDKAGECEQVFNRRYGNTRLIMFIDNGGGTDS